MSVHAAERRSPRRPNHVVGLALHTLRVGLFVAVIWLIHDAHERRIQAREAAVRLEVADELVTDLFVEPTRVTETGAVLNADKEMVGRLLQTSPQSDHIVGFSGPTNVLLAFDTDDRIIGLRILSSGDTKEHVQQVIDDRRFLTEFAGREAGNAASFTGIDAVSGATLTSLAITESVIHRLGGGLRSLRFPDPPTIDDVRQVFPEAERMEPSAHDHTWWDVDDAGGMQIGGLLRSSPAADNIVGYQGPTETLIGFDTRDTVIGFLVGDSYDNEPYVGYVREDAWYRNSFNGQQLWELANLDLDTAGVEGVSGATMTSLAVAEGMIAAAARRNNLRTATHEPTAPEAPRISARNWGTIGVLTAGLIIGLTTLRGKRWVRLPFQCVLIGYLGFTNGDLLSQALLVGWAQNGVPWESMLGMLLLSIAAFVLPITTKHNVYCHQLCPHGAAQQWLRPSRARRVHLPRWLDRGLTFIPGGLLLLVVAVAMGAVSMSLVDIEPFDAYLIGIAGVATISIAIVGLIASTIVPMAYCRYGCPTGALLEFIRRHAQSDRVTLRDAVAAACLMLALVLWR